MAEPGRDEIPDDEGSEYGEREGSLLGVGWELGKLALVMWLIHRFGWILGFPLLVLLMLAVTVGFFAVRAVVLWLTGFDIGAK